MAIVAVWIMIIHTGKEGLLKLTIHLFCCTICRMCSRGYSVCFEGRIINELSCHNDM